MGSNLRHASERDGNRVPDEPEQEETRHVRSPHEETAWNLAPAGWLQGKPVSFRRPTRI
jgi:hypothetical protein